MAKDRVCCNCGESFDYMVDSNKFEEEYDSRDWYIISLDGDYCYKCACEKAEEAISEDYEELVDVNERRCECCGSRFIVGEARVEFHSFVRSKDPIGWHGDFDTYKCVNCNLDEYEETIRSIPD